MRRAWRGDGRIGGESWERCATAARLVAVRRAWKSDAGELGLLARACDVPAERTRHVAISAVCHVMNADMVRVSSDGRVG